jgi:hypothetical protein
MLRIKDQMRPVVKTAAGGNIKQRKYRIKTNVQSSAMFLKAI